MHLWPLLHPSSSRAQKWFTVVNFDSVVILEKLGIWVQPFFPVYFWPFLSGEGPATSLTPLLPMEQSGPRMAMTLSETAWGGQLDRLCAKSVQN